MHVNKPPIPNKKPLFKPKNADAKNPRIEHKKHKIANSKNIFKGL